jgi:hypothetical protein
MFLLLAIVLFGGFAANVALGSFGQTPYLGDVGEMLLLFAASLAFVAAILKCEAARKSNDTSKS